MSLIVIALVTAMFAVCVFCLGYLLADIRLSKEMDELIQHTVSCHELIQTMDEEIKLHKRKHEINDQIISHLENK